MEACLRNDAGELTYNDGLLVLRNPSADTELILSGSDEFILYLEESGGASKVLRSSSFTLSMEKETPDQFTLLFSLGGFRVRVTYLSQNDIFKKKMDVLSNSAFFLKRICLETRRSSLKLVGGGEGLPFFAGSFGWLGIEFPAANNHCLGNLCSFWQAPYARTTHFSSLEVAYGVASCGTPSDSFRQYIERHALRKDKTPITVYGNWGLYDNMTPGDPIIDESLALQSVSSLASLMKRSGCSFDYYVMDAFWFKKDGHYLDYDNTIFPHGIGSTLDALAAIDVQYGLWFDLNFVHDHPSSFEEYSTDLGNGSYCFSEDAIHEKMENAIKYHLSSDHVKYLKFDFAYFECQNAKHNHSVEHVESKEKSVLSFISMISRLRKEEPELVVAAYNGWTINLDSLGGAKKPDCPIISPYWAFYVDYLYCGDPRSSLLPCSNFGDSLVYYTDGMVRSFYDSYIPLSSIDDHGTMIGNTGTIYYLGKDNFRLSLLSSAMRGTKKLNPYGDLGLLNDDDCRYFGYVERLFASIAKENMKTSFILGDVREGEAYGYEAHSKDEGYVFIANPSESIQDIVFSLSQWGDRMVEFETLIENGVIIERKEGLSSKRFLTLRPNEYVLLKWKINNTESFEGVMNIGSNETWLLSCHGYSLLSLSFKTIGGKEIRSPHAVPDSVVIDNEKGERLLAILPTKTIWSGVASANIDLSKSEEISIRNKGEPILLSYRFIK